MVVELNRYAARCRVEVQLVDVRRNHANLTEGACKHEGLVELALNHDALLDEVCILCLLHRRGVTQACDILEVGCVVVEVLV